MSSQAERKRRRRERNRIRQAESHGEAAKSPAEGQVGRAGTHAAIADNSPTQERMEKGDVSMPVGRGSRQMPAIALDAIGRYDKARDKPLAPEEMQALRQYEELRYAARRSIGVRGFVSCLAGGVGAHVSDLGAPHAEREYRLARAVMGAHQAYWVDALCDGTDVPLREFLAVERGAWRLAVHWG